MEGFEIALARFGLRQAVLEMYDRETGCRKAEANRRQGVRVASAGDCHGQILDHWIVADDQHGAVKAVFLDELEVAGRVLGIKLVEEDHAAGVGAAGDAFQGLGVPGRRWNTTSRQAHTPGLA